MEAYSKSEKLAGLFLFLALLGGITSLLLIGQGKGWFRKTQTFLVRFPQSYNLEPGAAVKMFNTEIGTVSRLRIVRVKDDHQVEVTIRINNDYVHLIRGNSVAQVESPTILGSEFLSISPGSYAYPLIPPYGTIPSRLKKTLADYLEEFQPEESLHKARQLLANLVELSEQFKAHEAKISSILAQFDTALDSVVAGRGTIGRLLMDRDLYNRLQKSVIRLEKILQNAEHVSGDAKASAGKLPPLVDRVNDNLDRLRCILLDVQKAAGQLPELLETADDATRTGQEVIEAIKANPLIRLTLPKTPAGEAIHVEPRTLP
ncbi:MAG: MlaD family protein [Desulfobacca sp.]|uniref:MlaD family protein n=1 Tax=Desulfobacca sp. TaxID=2067990 RepID=UPI00404AF1E1